MSEALRPRVLSIAGSDSSGGAGIQADIKSIQAAGGFAMTAITALTAQHTRGVTGVFYPPAAFLRAQLDAVADDVEIDAVKIGMLGRADVTDAVMAWLNEGPAPDIVVVDPVMIATSGDNLGTEHELAELLSLATVLTPNIPELATLTGSTNARNVNEALEQGKLLAARHNTAVVVKTGHLETTDVGNYWVTPDDVSHHSPSSRVETTFTHGTGCSLSSALATRLVRSAPHDALDWATSWLHGAIDAGPALHVGSPGGHGPVDHQWANPSTFEVTA